MIGRFFLIAGVIFLILGILINNGLKFSWIGNLPGDIHINKNNIHFIFPITTCLIASLLLNLILWLITNL